MNELSKLLADHLAKHGSQTKLAKRLGTTGATVSRWAKGTTLPLFEHCLGIAKVLKRPAIEIFDKRGDESYIKIYKNLFPNGLDNELATSSPFCHEHQSIFRDLDLVLHSGTAAAELITNNIVFARSFVEHNRNPKKLAQGIGADGMNKNKSPSIKQGAS